MENRAERHYGRVGDAFLVRELPRHGTNTFQLRKGDVLVRMAHTGDCFSDYCVWREGIKVGKWWGYDRDVSVTERLGNVVDDAVAIPYTQRGE